jgi:AraC-like DNA-binding protein
VSSRIVIVSMIVSHKPVAPLAPYIEKLWYCEEYLASHRKERVLPSGRFQLIIHLTDTFARQRDFASGEMPLPSPMLVVGTRSRFGIVDTSILQSVIGVVFRPGGARPFFDELAHCFYNETVPLNDVWNSAGSGLRLRLQEASTVRQKFRVVEAALLARLKKPFHLHPCVKYALEKFMQVQHVRSVIDISKEAGLSRRRFAQLFREQVGLTPKLYCRLERFQNVLRQIASSSAPIDWADLALVGGYYDQAHFNHDFYDFSGISPSTYLASNPRLTHVPMD